MQNRECIVFERTRDTEQRIHEPCACLWVRAHPVFNQSLGRFICNMRVQVSHLLAFFCLFVFFLGLTTKKRICIKSLLVGTQRQLCLVSIVSIFYPISLSHAQKMARIRVYKCAERKLTFIGSYSYKYRISKNQVLCSGQEKFTQDQ